MKTLCVIALARPLAAANRRFVTFGREARDHVGEWLGFRGHPMLARVNQRARVGHDADMAGEEDQVAPLELVASYVGFGTERRELEVAVARQLHAGGAPRKLDQPRPVDALARTPPPDHGGAAPLTVPPPRTGVDRAE